MQWLPLGAALLLGIGNAAECPILGLGKCPQPFDEHLPAAKDMLRWSQSQRVVGFRNTYRLYPGDVFHHDPAHISELQESAAQMPDIGYQFQGHHYGLKDYLQHQSATGLLILSGNRVLFEHYDNGNTASTLWTSRSVAKSIVSILVGVAIQEKLIGSVDDAVTLYLPELRQTAWQGVTLKNLLQHTSGVQWNENYQDPHSDFARLTHCEARADAAQCVLKLISSVTRAPGVKAGEVWSYNTGGAWLVGRILERATHMTIAAFLESRIWRPLGMQSDGVWEALRAGQVDMGGHGFNATLRDWGRFGLFVANAGRLPSGKALLPDFWIQESTHWTQALGSVTPATPQGQYGYQWWYLGVSPEAGGNSLIDETSRHTLWAQGIYGQNIAINLEAHLVMVQWSVWENADLPESRYDEQAIFFSALRQSLH